MSEPVPGFERLYGAYQRIVPPVRALAFLAIMVGVAGCEPDPVVIDSPAPPLPKVQLVNPDGCVGVSYSDFLRAQQLVSQPENEIITASLTSSGKGGGNGKDPTSAAEQYRQEIAAQYRLNIYDAQPVLDRLAQEDADGKLSYTEYVSAAQEFMAQLGIDVIIADNKTDINRGLGERPPSAKELSSPEMKQTIRGMLTYYSNLPKQYVALAGQKRIVLAAGFKDVVGYVYLGGDTAYFDVRYNVDAHIFGHELGHLFHGQECGPDGAVNDAEFGGINGGDLNLYNNVTFDNDTPNLTTYRQMESAVLQQTAQENKWQDNATMCYYANLLKRYHSQVFSYSSYHPNTAEATAEELSALTTPAEWLYVFDSESPELKAQETFILARIEAKDPALAAFFAAVSRRPVRPQDFNCGVTPTVVQRIANFRPSRPDSLRQG